MKFEERNLNPFAEPVEGANLREGEAYFSVTFVDDAMTIPSMETLIFIGTNTGINGAEIYRFQDVDSYRQEGAENGGFLFECSANELNNIFEFEKALEMLMQCSIRRRSV